MKGDDWAYGEEASAHGIPRDAIAPALGRWLGTGARVLAVGCGAAGVVDAVMQTHRKLDARGIDSEIAGSTDQAHPDRLTKLDPTVTNWRAAVPNAWRADLVLVVLPAFVSTASEGRRVLGEVGDPASHVGAWRNALRGAKSVLAKGGVVAIVTHPNAEAPVGGDAVDVEFAILAALHDEGLAGSFLGRVVLRPRTSSKGSSSVRHLSAFRRR